MPRHLSSIKHDELRRPVTAYFDTIRSGLERLLARAQFDGTLPSHVDVGALAVSLLAMMQGGAVLAQAY